MSSPSSSVMPVAVLGPTASGKSAVAMAVARRLGDIDLVSVDAMQVYRGMDIGTAKPTHDERAQVPHHLIDLVDATADFSVAEFQQHVADVRQRLASTGRRGLLVGGTGLYHRVVVDGLTLPGQWPDLRAELEAEATAMGPEVLHERLTGIDPTAAARMEPTNVRRVVRALEVCLGSGEPFSSFGPGLDSHPPADVVQIGLRWDRDVLAARIERRVRHMVDAGFLDEVRGLTATGMSRTARQALGYRELLDHVEGRISLDEAIDTTILRTRQFAVRQLRWFRRDPRVRWVDVVDDPVAEAAPVVAAALHHP
ncbi:tRNA (adenosine(37)-N6)-dimethylallyltransferase MiaA [soil metagenome]